MALTPNQTEKLQHLIDKRRDALLAELREDAARSREHPYAEHAGPAPDAPRIAPADWSRAWIPEYSAR